MKKLIMLTVLAACIALCAAVWPQDETVGETPDPTQELTVSAPETTVTMHKEETKVQPQAEEENAEPPETGTDPESAPTEIPAVPTVQSAPETVATEPIALLEPALEPPPKPIPTPEVTRTQKIAPSPTPTVIDVHPGDMVYVEGFGWLESQGAGTVIHDEMIYENGNKVGSMD